MPMDDDMNFEMKKIRDWNKANTILLPIFYRLTRVVRNEFLGSVQNSWSSLKSTDLHVNIWDMSASKTKSNRGSL